MLAVIFDIWLFGVARQWEPGADILAAWSMDLAAPWAGAGDSMLGAGVFRWTPVAAQIASLIGAVPWLAFQYAFLALQLGAIAWMSGKRWPYVVLLPPVLWNLYMGNVDLLMGAAIVAGFHWPGTWAFLFLTKGTPGIGVLWFAFRREWRSLAIALGTTAAIAAGSFMLAPDLWRQWIAALGEMSTLPQSILYPPLFARVPLAIVLTWYAARTDRRWLLPVACLVAVPNPWFVTWAILGASIALFRPDASADDVAERPFPARDDRGRECHPSRHLRGEHLHRVLVTWDHHQPGNL
jgi:hypothetical protein